MANLPELLFKLSYRIRVHIPVGKLSRRVCVRVHNTDMITYTPSFRARVSGYPLETGGLYLAFCASSFWYAFHIGHQPVCHRQIRDITDLGFFSAFSLIPHVSHFELIQYSSYAFNVLLCRSARSRLVRLFTCSIPFRIRGEVWSVFFDLTPDSIPFVNPHDEGLGGQMRQWCQNA
jgi:hypothetical protein